MKFIYLLFTICCILLGWFIRGIYDYPLEKYRKMDQILNKISQREYSKEYNCIDFSQDAQYELKKEGIESSIIIGHKEKHNNNHAYLGIWIDPQDNEFINGYEFKYVK